MYKKFCFFEGKVIVLTLVLIFLVTGNVLAGTTGKIAGKVIDQKTGEPLIGANVVIVGTTMGASTDNDGFYFIINVPPGNYSVTTSYIGYEMLTQSEVLVNVDRTTTLDFALTPEAVELGAVTVLAERPIIEQDVTGSTEILDTGYIERLPIIDLKDITRLQSGIYYTGETTYMRAGLATEVNYRLDGTSLNSGLLSDNWQRLNTTAMQEVSILTGGYNAEYGDAMSGVVNVVTKEASTTERNLHGTVKYRLRPAGKYHWGKNMYDQSLWKYTNFDLAFWQEQLQDPSKAAGFAQYFQRFYGWDGNTVPTANQLLSTYREQITPDPVLGDYTKRPEHDIEATFYGSPMENMNFLLSGRFKNGVNIFPQSEKYNPEYNIQAKFNYNLSPNKKLSLNLLRGWYKSSTYTESNWNNFESSQEAQWQPNADVREPYEPWGGYWLKGPEEKTVNMTTLKWQHTLNPATFYTVQLTYLTDDMTELQDYSRFKTDESTVGWGDSWFDLAGNFRLESRQIQVNNYSKSKIFSAKGDLTSQVHKSHQIKTGVQFRLFDVDYQHYYMEFPAGDVWHLDNVFDGKPLESAFYIQDKMEYKGLILNIGLRLDGFNAEHKYPQSIFDPLGFEPWNGGDGVRPSNTAPIWQANMPAKDWFATRTTDYRSFFEGKQQDKNVVDSEWKFALAPRVGLSFPITQNSKLRFNYGHFYQRPSWSKVLGFPTSWYDSDPFGSVRMDQWQGWYGQPGLTFGRTIQYELGFEQNLFDILRFDITAYYKDGSKLTSFSHQGTYNRSGGG
ncbi:MAG: carboxypeptidase-like regulatory domain-containing protein, partial [bacterium]